MLSKEQAVYWNTTHLICDTGQQRSAPAGPPQPRTDASPTPQPRSQHSKPESLGRLGASMFESCPGDRSVRPGLRTAAASFLSALKGSKSRKTHRERLKCRGREAGEGAGHLTPSALRAPARWWRRGVPLC